MSTNNLKERVALLLAMPDAAARLDAVADALRWPRPSDFPRSRVAASWERKDWDEFARSLGFGPAEETAHSFKYTHPVGGHVVSFSKTSGDFRAGMAAMMQARVHARLLTLAAAEQAARAIKTWEHDNDEDFWRHIDAITDRAQSALRDATAATVAESAASGVEMASAVACLDREFKCTPKRAFMRAGMDEEAASRCATYVTSSMSLRPPRGRPDLVSTLREVLEDLRAEATVEEERKEAAKAAKRQEIEMRQAELKRKIDEQEAENAAAAAKAQSPRGRIEALVEAHQQAFLRTADALREAIEENIASEELKSARNAVRDSIDELEGRIARLTSKLADVDKSNVELARKAEEANNAKCELAERVEILTKELASANELLTHSGDAGARVLKLCDAVAAISDAGGLMALMTSIANAKQVALDLQKAKA